MNSPSEFGAEPFLRPNKETRFGNVLYNLGIGFHQLSGQALLNSMAMNYLENQLFDFDTGSVYQDSVVLQIGDRFYNTEIDDGKIS